MGHWSLSFRLSRATRLSTLTEDRNVGFCLSQNACEYHSSAQLILHLSTGQAGLIIDSGLYDRLEVVVSDGAECDGSA